jgi:hypothetical protein
MEYYERMQVTLVHFSPRLMEEKLEKGQVFLVA